MNKITVEKMGEVEVEETNRAMRGENCVVGCDGEGGLRKRDDDRDCLSSTAFGETLT